MNVASLLSNDAPRHKQPASTPQPPALHHQHQPPPTPPAPASSFPPPPPPPQPSHYPSHRPQYQNDPFPRRSDPDLKPQHAPHQSSSGNPAGPVPPYNQQYPPPPPPPYPYSQQHYQQPPYQPPPSHHHHHHHHHGPVHHYPPPPTHHPHVHSHHHHHSKDHQLVPNNTLPPPPQQSRYGPPHPPPPSYAPPPPIRTPSALGPYPQPSAYYPVSSTPLSYPPPPPPTAPLQHTLPNPSDSRRPSSHSIQRPSISNLDASPVESMFTPQTLAAYADALTPKALASLPNLGTFVYPNLPFPIALGFNHNNTNNNDSDPELELESRQQLQPVLRPSDSAHVKGVGGSLSSSTTKSAPFYLMTICISSAHLLTAIPSRFDGAFKLWGSQSYGGYTDDSDLRLVLLHSGFITLEDMIKAKSEGKDIKAKFRIGRFARSRYVGGYAEVRSQPASATLGGSGALPSPRSLGSASPAAKEVRSRSKHGTEASNKESSDSDKKSDVIRSFAWGNSHDGGSIEVVGCEVVKRGTAHSLHAPNRRARMAQFARHRSRLNLAPKSGPSGKVKLRRGSGDQEIPIIPPSNRPQYSSSFHVVNSPPMSETDTLYNPENDIIPGNSGTGDGATLIGSGPDNDDDDEIKQDSDHVAKWRVVLNFGDPRRKRKSGVLDDVESRGGNEDRDDGGGWFLYNHQVVQEVVTSYTSASSSSHSNSPVTSSLSTPTPELGALKLVHEGEGVTVPLETGTGCAKRRKIERKLNTNGLFLENEDERYVLTLNHTNTTSAEPTPATFSLSVVSRPGHSSPVRRGLEPVLSPNDASGNVQQDKSSLLGNSLSLEDIKFTPEGMYVWVSPSVIGISNTALSSDGASSTNLEQQNGGKDIPKSPSSGDSALALLNRPPINVDSTVNGPRSAWFCRIRRWRYDVSYSL